MHSFFGWLLDIYECPEGGVTLWFICDDGQRRCVQQSFPTTFYAAGPSHRLKELWKFLRSQPVAISLDREEERRDLFNGQAIVLSATLEASAGLQGVFQSTVDVFPDLTFYDIDINVSLRHAAVYGTFPFARCHVTADETGNVLELNVLDSRWDLDPEPPPLRVLKIEPDVDPFYGNPKQILVHSPKATSALDLDDPSTLGFFSYLLKQHDPDVILSSRGDTWLLRKLLEMSGNKGYALPLNRDPNGQITYKKERTYYAYGGVVYRGPQVRLAGRLHIDMHNTVSWDEYGLEGVFEMSRVTSLPIQTAARVSPGTGISSMQIITALEQRILVPLRKEQVERPKTISEILDADKGGLIGDPVIGLHADAAELDFAAMYGSLVVHFNISPETVNTGRPTAELVPELNMFIDRDHPGLIPMTLAPLLEKRTSLKQQLLTLSSYDCRYQPYKARAAAHKWLMVTCVGYMGYINARFGCIETHEAVLAFGREVMLRAQEAAEDLGCDVLHRYVDGLWVKKPGWATARDFQPLIDEILVRTNLPILLEGVYKWCVFLGSRRDPRIAIPNQYFGVFKDGEIKTRGIETRRHDTPAFVAETQLEVLQILANAESADHLKECMPEIRELVNEKLTDLRLGQVPPEKLIVHLGVSRNSGEYRAVTPASAALKQLEEYGKRLRPGQTVRLLYTLGKPGGRAWDLPETLDSRTINIPRYKKLLIRAVEVVIQQIGTLAIPNLTLDDLLSMHYQNL